MGAYIIHTNTELSSEGAKIVIVYVCVCVYISLVPRPRIRPGNEASVGMYLLHVRKRHVFLSNLLAQRKLPGRFTGQAHH